ncbi:MAG: AlpA family phage regulatory protein [Reyranella sp.]|nr:AlpA family phage regulatory protein [Reyranella sp.]
MARRSKLAPACTLEDPIQPSERRATEQCSFKRMIRRRELRRIVPLADTTIYEMERRGEFPRRFNLTARCVAWDLSEVEAWIEERRRRSKSTNLMGAPIPDVRLRRLRPVHS